MTQSEPAEAAGARGSRISKHPALANGAIECTLPTTPQHRYRLTYTVHGPCAVGWWNGEIEPLSRRALDLIGGNHGAFISGASNIFPGLVGQHVAQDLLHVLGLQRLVLLEWSQVPMDAAQGPRTDPTPT